MRASIQLTGLARNAGELIVIVVRVNTSLLVGFDSAWTPHNSGAIAALILRNDGNVQEIGLPVIVNYPEAERLILDWQREYTPDRTLILLDQPTIVKNPGGQRPVEGIVSSSVSLRLGGMQPASQSRVEMFGEAAPVWAFLTRFGGPADPLRLTGGSHVIETYPVLALIALGWLRPGRGVSGTLPKYNPQRTKTFLLGDWKFVCERASAFFSSHASPGIAAWLEKAGKKPDPKKSDQDRLDACLCLIVALWLHHGRECLMTGNLASGYIIVPHESSVLTELANRCMKTGLSPAEWTKVFRIIGSGAEPKIDVPSPAPTVPVATAPQPVRPATPNRLDWTLPKIARLLDQHHQRATYGAVAGILGVLPRGVMNGRSKSPECSWIVAASGPEKGKPTGYDIDQIHFECLRQIRENRAGVIVDSYHLLQWLIRVA
jgi:predicted RNase H-like nuclease